MKTAALISGGKDSIFSIMNCLSQGHDLIALANLSPFDCSRSDHIPKYYGNGNENFNEEINSFMFQSIGFKLVPYLAQCIDCPLFTRQILGSSVQTTNVYDIDENDEVEDLFHLLKSIKDAHPELEAVCCGAILSTYQRVRVEHVCKRLGLHSLAPLWMKDQNGILCDMISCKLQSIIVKVAAVGLDQRDLGKTIAQMYPKLLKLNSMYDVHICGEGGEYETFTINAPFFKKRIEIIDSEIITDTADVYYLSINDIRLVENTDYNPNWLNEMKLLAAKYISLDPSFDCIENHCHLDGNGVSSVLELTKLPVKRSLTSHQVSISRNGEFTFISGCTGGSLVEDIGLQTRKALLQMEMLLKEQELNGTLKDAVQITVYVSDMSNFAKLNNEYISFFGFTNPPTRVTVEVCQETPVFIDALFYIKQQEAGLPRNHLHVQSISYWAPSNIGPYSQAISVSSKVWLSGMIGLVPSSMILALPVTKEPAQSLQSVERVLSAFGNQETKMDRNVIFCICYITPNAEIEMIKLLWKRKLPFTKCEPMFVAVPRLPRNASVEWQFAFFYPAGWRETMRQNCDLDPTAAIELPQLDFEITAFQLPYKGKVYISTKDFSKSIVGWICKIDGTDSWDDMAKKLISKIKAKLKKFVMLRVFHSLIPATEFSKFQMVFQSCVIPGKTSITFVPVLWIDQRGSSVGVLAS